MNVVIIEDEGKSVNELVSILAEIDPSIKIAGVCESITESLEWFRNNLEPDLVFSDIQLADGSSFEIYMQLNLSAPIIFFTAYDSYLLDAFETNGIGYLMKPIATEDVRKALEKYLRLRDKNNNLEQTKAIGNIFQEVGRGYKSCILVYRSDQIIPLSVDAICFVYSTNNTTVVYTISGEKYEIRTTIESLEVQLNPHNFFRASRQFLLQRSAIATIERFFSRKLMVKLSQPTPEIVSISKTRASEFLRWLEGL